MKRPSPLAIRLAERILSEEHHPLMGDLEWTFQEWCAERGTLSAHGWLWGTLFLLVPRLFIRDIIWQHTMLKNYLTLALRHVRKYRAFSFINVFGLALSMSVCLLILTLMADMRSDDGFHENGDSIYRVTTELSGVWGRTHLATSSPMVGPDLIRELDDVEALVQMTRTSGKLTREDGRMATFRGLYVDSTFFDVFSFELEVGNPARALTQPNQMVVSRDLADRLFPDADPIGQLVERPNGLWEITGVMAPLPGRSHLDVDALFSYVSLPSVWGEEDRALLSSWANHTRFYNYLLLAPGASKGRIEALANSLSATHWTEEDVPGPEHRLQQITNINLGWDLSNEISSTVPRVFAIVMSLFATVLLITATFNYINLTVSRSLRRRAEIGVRQVVGAHRRQLIQQFVTEAVVTCFLALLVAWGVLQFLIAKYNSLGAMQDEGMTITMSSMDPMLLVKFLIFALLVGMLAGILPALRISRQSPVSAIRGATPSLSGVRFLGRKALVVFQFTISIVAIAFVGVVFKQSAFLLSSDAGFDEEQLLHMELADVDHERVAEAVRRIPGVVRAAPVSHAPASGSRYMVDVRRPDMEETQLILRFSVDNETMAQYGIELVAGRLFNPELASDQTEAVILTEKALPFLGLGAPLEAVGKMLVYDTSGEENRIEVIGVVTDFLADGFAAGYQPVSLVHRPDQFNVLSVRLAEGDPRPALGQLEAVWDELAPGLPLTYTFLDDQIAKNLSYLRDSMTILGGFALMIVIIACLGLLGMAMFTSETRLKEVGIRKSLGADSWNLVRLLSGEYVRLIVIAVVVATPLAWTLCSFMLNTFANRIDMSVGAMLTGVIPVLLLAILAIGSQTWRAALANPVDVMRAE